MASTTDAAATTAAATSTALEGAILGMGNPLLDISADVPASLLTKYEVKLNDAILATEKHIPVYKELVDTYKVDYIAGGATQNSIRVAQWLLPTPKATAYIGCVGKDAFGEQLAKEASADGVDVHYMISETEPTGTCAVLINDTERSLIANLAAANAYKIKHLEQASIQAIVQRARIYYSSGFFLTVSPDSMLSVAKHAAETGKTYALNLAAPFICQFFGTQLAEVMKYTDIVFGNESESAAYAEANGMTGATAAQVGMAIASLPKENGSRCRTVILTHGAEPTVVVHQGKVTEFPCEVIPKAELVDQNGAGDAFVGGFLAQLVRGKDLEQCVLGGQAAARVILKQSGCTLPAERPNMDNLAGPKTA